MQKLASHTLAFLAAVSISGVLIGVPIA